MILITTFNLAISFQSFMTIIKNTVLQNISNLNTTTTDILVKTLMLQLLLIRLRRKNIIISIVYYKFFMCIT